MKPEAVVFLAAVVHACLLPHERDGSDEGNYLEKRQKNNKGPQWEGLAVSKTNRFKSGNVPLGIGSNKKGFENLGDLAILSYEEINSALDALAGRNYTNITVKLDSDKKTHGNKPINILSVGQEPRAFLVGGIHGRERGGPDNIIYFIADLLHAHESREPLSYGNKNYTTEEVRKVLDAGFVAIPAANPDGINHDQTYSNLWRKNLRDYSPEKHRANPIGYIDYGVDLNRNFAVFRDEKRTMYSCDIKETTELSDVKAIDYAGPSAFSEPETLAIKSILDTVPSITWYLDLHSAVGKVLYGWGNDLAQSEDPDMYFGNVNYDGWRGIGSDKVSEGGYKEYLERDHFNDQRNVSQRMVQTMNGIEGNPVFEAAEEMNLDSTQTPIMGSSDEAMAKYYSRTCNATRVGALTFEFGTVGESAEFDKTFQEKGQQYAEKKLFYPDAKRYRRNVKLVSAGLMEFLLHAAGDAGVKKLQKCDGESSNTKSETSSGHPRPNRTSSKPQPSKKICKPKKP